MALLEAFDIEMKKKSDIEIDDSILSTPYHGIAVSEVIRQYLAANQKGTHATKNRSEVSYSTRKLYRQKGTGSARAGSAKSPIRRHGGTIFGPQPRSHSFRLNKKIRRLATRSVFAEKIRQGGLMVLESLDLSDNKTRNFKLLINKLKLNERVLIVVDEISENLRLASRNIPDVHVISYRSLSVYEMMKHNKVIFLKGALEAYSERLTK